MKISKKVFSVILDLGVLIGRAIAKRPDLEKELNEVKEAFRKAKLPESDGGERITFSEWAKDISPEALDVLRTLSPELDSLIEMFIKDEDDKEAA